MENKVDIRKIKKLRIIDAYRGFKDQTLDICDKDIQSAMLEMDGDIVKYHEKLDVLSQDLKTLNDFLRTAGIPFDHEMECINDNGIIYSLLYLNQAKEEHHKKKILLQIKDEDNNITVLMLENTSIINKFKMKPYIKPFLYQLKDKLKKLVEE